MLLGALGPLYAIEDCDTVPLLQQKTVTISLYCDRNCDVVPLKRQKAVVLLSAKEVVNLTL